MGAGITGDAKGRPSRCAHQTATSHGKTAKGTLPAILKRRCGFGFHSFHHATLGSRHPVLVCRVQLSAHLLVRRLRVRVTQDLNSDWDCHHRFAAVDLGVEQGEFLSQGQLRVFDSGYVSAWFRWNRGFRHEEIVATSHGRYSGLRELLWQWETSWPGPGRLPIGRRMPSCPTTEARSD